MVFVGLLHEKDDDKKMLLVGSSFHIQYKVGSTIVKTAGILLDLNKEKILFRRLDRYDKFLCDVCICLADIIDIKLID